MHVPPVDCFIEISASARNQLHVPFPAKNCLPRIVQRTSLMMLQKTECSPIQPVNEATLISCTVLDISPSSFLPWFSVFTLCASFRSIQIIDRVVRVTVIIDTASYLNTADRGRIPYVNLRGNLLCKRLNNGSRKDETVKCYNGCK